MRKAMIAVCCAGLGFCLGVYRLVPIWLVIVLAILGAGLWGAGECIERRKSAGGDKS
ncbi:MFS transporter [Pseudomonas floridensis]